MQRKATNTHITCLTRETALSAYFKRHQTTQTQCKSVHDDIIIDTLVLGSYIFNSLFCLITLHYTLHMFPISVSLFLSLRFDGDIVPKETPAAVPREAATPASKPAKATKGREVRNHFF